MQDVAEAADLELSRSAVFPGPQSDYSSRSATIA